MQDNNIDAFYGELFYHPVPLELSLNSCSHKCSYCFANSRCNTKTANLKSIIKTLTNLNNGLDREGRNDLRSYLLMNKYPIVLSNKSDPFAKTNYKMTIPLLEVLTDLGIPVYIQTKGGDGLDEAMRIVKPSVWYITMAFDDTSKQRTIEKASPSVEHRQKLIEKLLAHGHSVQVGINPYVPTWWRDERKFIKRLYDMGVHDFLFQLLHLNYKLIENIGSSHGMGEEYEWSQKRKRPDEVVAAMNDLINYTESIGGNPLLHKRPAVMHFWDTTKQLYPKLFPTLFDFVNHCHANYDNFHEITFADYWSFYEPLFPKGEFRLRGYIFQQDIKYASKHRLQFMTFRTLLQHIWNHKQFNDHLPKHPNFLYTTDGKKNLRDSEGNYIYTFYKGG